MLHFFGTPCRRMYRGQRCKWRRGVGKKQGREGENARVDEGDQDEWMEMWMKGRKRRMKGRSRRRGRKGRRWNKQNLPPSRFSFSVPQSIVIISLITLFIIIMTSICLIITIITSININCTCKCSKYQAWSSARAEDLLLVKIFQLELLYFLICIFIFVASKLKIWEVGMLEEMWILNCTIG